jgi:hypothetical protein
MSGSLARFSVRLLRIRAAAKRFGTRREVLVLPRPLLARCWIRSALESVASASGACFHGLTVEQCTEPPTCIPARRGSCSPFRRSPCAPGAADGGEKVRYATAALGDEAVEHLLASRPSILSRSSADNACSLLGRLARAHAIEDKPCLVF